MEGKAYLVTGATSGIGLDVAKALLRRGAWVGACARSRERHEAGLLTWARDHGVAHRLEWREVDFASPGSLAGFDVSTLPMIDGLVNSAGVVSVLPLRAETVDGIARQINVNLVSPIEFTRALLKGRKVNDGASLVYLGSINGTQVGSKGHTVYAASKGGLKGFVMALSQELAPRKIRVNAVAPGLVRTPMHGTVEAAVSAASLAAYEATYPLGIGSPADVTGAVSFLLDDASRWMTGQTLVLDGGVTVS